MNQVVVFTRYDGQVSVLWPQEQLLSAVQIGIKDVPYGIPFWVVDAATIPADREFRSAWELDLIALGEPSGVGTQV